MRTRACLAAQLAVVAVQLAVLIFGLPSWVSFRAIDLRAAQKVPGALLTEQPEVDMPPPPPPHPFTAPMAAQSKNRTVPRTPVSRPQGSGRGGGRGAATAVRAAAAAAAAAATNDGHHRGRSSAPPTVTTEVPLIFLSGPHGGGHSALGAVLMRTPSVLPMTLTQEQAFVQLWWGSSGGSGGADSGEWNASAPADADVLGSAAEVVSDWAASANPGQKLAFAARGCVRSPRQPAAAGTGAHTADCSWISAAALQIAGMQQQQQQQQPSASAAALELTGETFGYPFLDSALEPGVQRLHFPRLADLQRLCERAVSPPLSLRVLALHRAPLDALDEAVGIRPQRFWRVADRPDMLKRVAKQMLQGGSRALAELRRLPSGAAVVVDVAAVLASPRGAGAASLGSFTDLPAPALGAALAAAAADDKRAAAARVAAGPKSRRYLLGQALAAASAELLAELAGGATPLQSPLWHVALSAALSARPGSAVAPLPAMESPSRALPLSRPQPAPSPPLHLSKGERLFTHVINPFNAPSSEHKYALRLTLASIAAAASAARRRGIAVEVIAAVLPADKGVLSKVASAVAALVHDTGDGDDGDDGDVNDRWGTWREVVLPPAAGLSEALPGVEHRRGINLPLLPALLRAAASAGTGRYLIYSNIDIALQLDCYVQLASLLRRQPHTPVSAVREEFEHANVTTFTLEEAAERRGRGLPHPGHDMWVFPRVWVPDLHLGSVALGVSLVATALNQALLAKSSCRITFLSRHLTYHVVEGESVVRHKWLQRARNDPLFFQTYTSWNCMHTKAALGSLLADASTSTSYRRCWFAPQVAKSMSSYKCAKHVRKLPREAGSLWKDHVGAEAVARAFPGLLGHAHEHDADGIVGKLST